MMAPKEDGNEIDSNFPCFYGFFMEIGHDPKLEQIQQHKISMYIPDPPTQ